MGRIFFVAKASGRLLERIAFETRKGTPPECCVSHQEKTTYSKQSGRAPVHRELLR